MEQTTQPSGHGEIRAPRVADRRSPHIGLNLLGGVALPLFCLVADPILFRSWTGRGAMLSSGRVAAYSFFALQMLALTLWLCVPRLRSAGAAILAGVLFAGSVASLLLGIALIPFSLIGLMAIIGILGFSPLLVSWIYYKNAMCAYRAARSEDSIVDQQHNEQPPHLAPRYMVCWAAGLLSIVIPYAIQSIPRQMTATVIRAAIDEDEVVSAAALNQISNWKTAFQIFADTDWLARQADRYETGDQRYARIDRVFLTITDEEVWHRLAVLDD